MSWVSTVKEKSLQNIVDEIKTEDGKDVFFHYSQLVMPGFKDIEEGADVEFDPLQTERGVQAQHIVKL